MRLGAPQHTGAGARTAAAAVVAAAAPQHHLGRRLRTGPQPDKSEDDTDDEAAEAESAAAPEEEEANQSSPSADDAKDDEEEAEQGDSGGGVADTEGEGATTGATAKSGGKKPQTTGSDAGDADANDAKGGEKDAEEVTEEEEGKDGESSSANEKSAQQANDASAAGNTSDEEVDEDTGTAAAPKEEEVTSPVEGAAASDKASPPGTLAKEDEADLGGDKSAVETKAEGVEDADNDADDNAQRTGGEVIDIPTKDERAKGKTTESGNNPAGTINEEGGGGKEDGEEAAEDGDNDENSRAKGESNVDKPSIADKPKADGKAKDRTKGPPLDEASGAPPPPVHSPDADANPPSPPYAHPNPIQPCGFFSLPCHANRTVRSHPLASVSLFVAFALFVRRWWSRRSGGRYDLYNRRDGLGEYMSIELLEGNFDDEMSFTGDDSEDEETDPDAIVQSWRGVEGKKHIPSGVGDDLEDEVADEELSLEEVNG